MTKKVHKHLRAHSGNCACNSNRKFNMTDDWEQVDCKLCMKSDQYLMAKQLEHDCFVDEIKKEETGNKTMDDNTGVHVQTQEQWDEVTKFYDIELDRAKWETYTGNSVIHPSRALFSSLNYDKICNYPVLSFAEWKDKYNKVDEPKSACGRTLDEFMEACNNDCSNVEFNYMNNTEWVKSGLNNTNDIMIDIKLENNGITSYRIKEPTPSIEQQEKDGCDKEVKHEKEYTISESQMNEICKLVESGLHCSVEFVNDLDKMKDDAFEMKDTSLQLLSQIVDSILGDD